MRHSSASEHKPYCSVARFTVLRIQMCRKYSSCAKHPNELQSFKFTLTASSLEHQFLVRSFISRVNRYGRTLVATDLIAAGDRAASDEALASSKPSRALEFVTSAADWNCVCRLVAVLANDSLVQAAVASLVVALTPVALWCGGRELNRWRNQCAGRAAANAEVLSSRSVFSRGVAPCASSWTSSAFSDRKLGRKDCLSASQSRSGRVSAEVLDVVSRDFW
ncbi:hypothetical protein AXG93_1881s1320 [Marchantia polymorpha subsp. ruderalis]|uniref:Uncharacterized protein n=1 Tax=Marchantia polymorpha subsp. ruderalis TaxID=1480154 RepID=A0A176W481_MARPO|nr:hypothetical protein AXG93_1881s1320 [Marchantia polymorpha subsp. ruderalis]